MKYFVLTLTTFLTLSSAAFADATNRPDDHAPIGVMGDHHHKQGEWMTSYRYGHMSMKGNRDGNDEVSTTEVLGSFMMAPLEMEMDMHMFGVMYGATDKLTLTAMLPYLEKQGKMINRMGMRMRNSTEGVGDIKLGSLYALHEGAQDSLLLGVGASLPTGSIDEESSAGARLPYGMQLGSGTVDPMLRLTYTRKYDGWSWGTQGSTTVRFGKNDEGYRLGNVYGVTGWAARNLSHYASLSLRLEGKHWDNIHGQDNRLNPMMTPASRADLRGGERIDALVGLNLYQSKGDFAGQRLAAEFGVPVYQRLDGPQMEVDYQATIGWQWAF